ncbi:MAG TPA: glutamate mutase L [Candidatus Limnocylindria bacterium]|nr:glutamate mutase L [Candidatus Limnocylindria bacterium]
MATAARPTAEISLLVDAGSAWTKASVVGRTRGRWRIVAHAAQPSAWEESVLIGALVDRMHDAVDQRLRDDAAELLAAAPRISCHTPFRPGRLAIAAVTGELSGAAGRRAAESAGWLVVETAAADDGRPLPERLSALTSAEVDGWLIVGGFDDARPEQAIEAAAIIAAARGGGRSPVIWAGSALLADEVSALFDPGVVSTVANPRPSADEEDAAPLRHHLEELLDRLVESGGTRNLAPIGFRRTIAEIAREEGLRVGAVDLGARYATWVAADGTGDEVIAESRVFAAGGLGAPSLATAGSIGRLARAMPIAIDELAVADTLQNMRARPGTIPYSDEELAVTLAAARARLTALAEQRGSEPVDLLIGAGRVFAAAPTPMQAMRLLLEGLRPPGVTQLAIDAAGALPPLGSLPDDQIAEGIGVLRDDLLVPLGTTVVTRGGRTAQVAIRARLHRTGWPEPAPIEVRYGQVVVLPLPRGEVAELELELEGGAVLPAGRRAHKARVTVSGGTVGLVLDARDVPLHLPRRADDRRQVLAGWREILLREPVQTAPAEAPVARQPGAAQRILRMAGLGDRAGRSAAGAGRDGDRASNEEAEQAEPDEVRDGR